LLFKDTQSGSYSDFYWLWSRLDCSPSNSKDGAFPAKDKREGRRLMEWWRQFHRLLVVGLLVIAILTIFNYGRTFLIFFLVFAVALTLMVIGEDWIWIKINKGTWSFKGFLKRRFPQGWYKSDPPITPRNERKGTGDDEESR
jgi:hypothetical protein